MGAAQIDRSKPFTLRMAGYELLGEAATESILEKTSAYWLAFVLMAHIESNNVQTETAQILRDWHDRRHADDLLSSQSGHAGRGVQCLLMGVQRVQRTGEALLLLDEVTGYAKANADAARTKDEQDTWRAHERNLRRVRAALPAHSGSGVREDVARADVIERLQQRFAGHTRVVNEETGEFKILRLG